MATEPQPPTRPKTVELPAPTVWPLVLSVGLMLVAAGLVLGLALSAVGGLLLIVGLTGWVSQLLPGKGHEHVSTGDVKPQPSVVKPGTVEQLKPGMPGYRFRLPEKVRPVSAGIKGGLVGGLLMPIPALLWGLISRKGLFYPVNLLAGLALPGLQQMTDAELGQFHLGLFVIAVVIHVVISASLGLIYGVMLPTLPTIPRPLAWGGLLLPLLWSAVSFILMGMVNKTLNDRVDWLWFIFSQFVFGVMAAVTVLQMEKKYSPVFSGAVGGIVGGLLMPVPAVLWGLAMGHGIWYPINLLAGTVLPGLDGYSTEELMVFNAGWFATALVIHAVFSIGFGIVYGLALLKLPHVPGPLSWGGVLLPLLWTGASYGLMSVLNPTMEERVDWPWFVVSQFVFGVAAAIVVVRAEQIPIPPAGSGQPTEHTP